MARPLGYLSAALLIGGLACGPALAEGIELQKVVRPSMGGDFVVMPVFSTNEAVQGLSYNVFSVESNGSLGAAIEGVVLRPGVVNTSPGEKRRVLMIVPRQSVQSERLLAVCMWKEPTLPTSGGRSQLLAAFRYCKLFTARP